MMPAWAMSAVRTGIQWLVPAVLSVAAGWHIELPAGADGALRAVLIAAAVAAWTAGVRWLETRPTTTQWGRMCRAVGRGLMLGWLAQPSGYTTMPVGATTLPDGSTSSGGVR
jgi:hypothetical protein